MASFYDEDPTSDQNARLTTPKSPSPHMATTTVKVDGMTCGACTSAVEAAFNDLPGAGEVSVSLVMGRAVVNHDPSILSPEQVAERIEDRGFDALVLSTDMPKNMDVNTETTGNGSSQISQTTMAIEGMTCGACTSAVEGGLKDVNGVRSVSVSLLSERAVIEHDKSLITPEQLVEIIEDRGFGATVLETKAPENLGNSSTNAPNRQLSTTIAIEGMTCGACTSSIIGAFKDVDGVVQFDISLLAERASIVHDPLILPPERIVSIIEDVGFDAKVLSSTAQISSSPQSSKSIRLSIYGLPDATAAAALEERLRRKDGITSVELNFTTSRATVTYNSTIGIRSIVEDIEEAGYNALVADAEENNAQLESLAKTKEIQEWKKACLFSASFAVPVFLISMIFPMYLHFLDFGKFDIIPGLYVGDLLCLALTIPVQFGVGRRFYVSSYKSLKHGSPTMDVLVMMGTSAAFFFSIFAMSVAVWAPPHSRPGVVFDTSTMLITFISLGRWLENRAKGQTSKALSRLMSLAPSMASIYEDPIAAEKAAEEWASEKTGDTAPSSSVAASIQKYVPTELLQVGDVVLLRPGDKVPADGIVIRGESFVDESMITGEPLPIHKKRGNTVIAGTVNGTGSMDFKVTRAGRDTQLSQIVKLVQDAQTSRAPIQRMADVLAGYFVPVIISLGLITFLAWMVLSHALPYPPKIFLQEGNGGKIMVCLKLCISVIVFACPCALGLSTPTAVMVGTGVGAENGILVKGGAALEAATRVNHIVFDKTGTLTEGKMSVSEAKIEPVWSSTDMRRKLWWTIVGLGEVKSEHPVARAILSAAKQENSLADEDPLDGTTGDFAATVGKGVSATVEPAFGAERKRYTALIGNTAFLESQNVQLPKAIDMTATDRNSIQNSTTPYSKSDSLAGITCIHVAIDGQYSGTISLRDSLKPSAVATVAALHRMGYSISLVTGDAYAAAITVAKAVGISTTSVKAGASPNDKQAIVAGFQESGDHVAMVGDGINDSPALATAYVGIALASGTDVAMEAADIVLMRSDDLLAVPASLSLARTIFNRIRLNLLWACVYNIIGLPFAMGFFLPFGGISLHPMAAGAAMAASSVSVVCSSLLLKFWRRPRWMTVERLESEISMGKIRRTDLTDDLRHKPMGLRSSSSTLVRSLRTQLTRLVFGRHSRQAREEEGYVALQAVEPSS